jgi:hypothetical protein
VRAGSLSGGDPGPSDQEVDQSAECFMSLCSIGAFAGAMPAVTRSDMPLPRPAVTARSAPRDGRSPAVGVAFTCATLRKIHPGTVNSRKPSIVVGNDSIVTKGRTLLPPHAGPSPFGSPARSTPASTRGACVRVCGLTVGTGSEWWLAPCGSHPVQPAAGHRVCYGLGRTVAPRWLTLFVVRAVVLATTADKNGINETPS